MRAAIVVPFLTLLVLTNAEDGLERLKALEERYRKLLLKHKGGEVIDNELTACARNSVSTTECAIQVVKKYGGDKLDATILEQLRSLGHFVEDTNSACHQSDTDCRLQATKAALPQVMFTARTVLQDMARDTRADTMEELKEFQDLFTRIESSFAGNGEDDHRNMVSELERKMEDLKLSTISSA